MGDPKTQANHVVGILIGKVLMGASFILIGMIAKIAIDSSQQRLTKAQIRFKVSVMFLIGFVSFVACEAGGIIKWAGVVTPLATMLGETLAFYILNNAKSWLDWLSKKVKK